MLELVLRDHADEEVVVSRQLREQLDDGLAHLTHVCARRGGLEDQELGALRPAVRERVVELVVDRRERLAAAGLAEQPELLEVADVGEIPDERRLERRDLARQLLVVERLEQGLGSRARVLEDVRELSR